MGVPLTQDRLILRGQADVLWVPIPALLGRIFREWGAEGGADLNGRSSLPRSPHALESDELQMLEADSLSSLRREEQSASLNLRGPLFGDGGNTFPGPFCSWTSELSFSQTSFTWLALVCPHVGTCRPLASSQPRKSLVLAETGFASILVPYCPCPLSEGFPTGWEGGWRWERSRTPRAGLA